MTLPNQLTTLRILFTPFIAWMLLRTSQYAQVAAFLLFILASLTDWYDGYTARKYGYVSTWGKFFDPLADKILVTAVLLVFCILGYFPAWMIVIIIVRDVLITFLRSYAIFKGRAIMTSLLAKAKTFIQMVVIYMIFLYHLVLRIDLFSKLAPATMVVQENHIILYSMFLVSFLTVISGVAYIIANRFYLRQMAGEIFRIFLPTEH